MTQLANGAIYVLDGTTITHQIENGITAAVQNTADGASVEQTVELMVGIENYHAVMAGPSAAMKAGMLNEELARFGSTLGL